MLATILCTDIVDSTAKAAELGDAAWMALMHRHDRTARAIFREQRGVEINTTGDGFLVAFDSPGRAVQAAHRLAAAAAALGLSIRSGLHVGECVRSAGSVPSGVALNVAVRIAALAGGGEVLTSQTVRDLTVGGGLVFEERGEHALKGVPGPGARRRRATRPGPGG